MLYECYISFFTPSTPFKPSTLYNTTIYPVSSIPYFYTFRFTALTCHTLFPSLLSFRAFPMQKSISVTISCNWNFRTIFPDSLFVHISLIIRQLWFCVGIWCIWRCERGSFTVRKSLFRGLKRALPQCGTGFPARAEKPYSLAIPFSFYCHRAG